MQIKYQIYKNKASGTKMNHSVGSCISIFFIRKIIYQYNTFSCIIKIMYLYIIYLFLSTNDLGILILIEIDKQKITKPRLQDIHQNFSSYVLFRISPGSVSNSGLVEHENYGLFLTRHAILKVFPSDPTRLFTSPLFLI